MKNSFITPCRFFYGKYGLIVFLVSIFLPLNLNSQSIISFPASGNASNAIGAGAINNRGAYQKFYQNGQQSKDLPKIMLVDNLNSSGSGSFNAAFTNSSPRIIVPRVSGYIAGTSSTANSYVTFAGQTSPNGITLVGTSNSALIFRGNYGVLRFFRISAPNKGDGMGIQSNNGSDIAHIILDHVTAFWSSDENLSITSLLDGDDYIDDVTMQWCLNYTPAYNRHGSLVNGGGTSLNNPSSKKNERISFIRNYWAHFENRSPQLDGWDGVEYVGNVIYNGDANATNFVTNNKRVNVIGNHWKQGPLSMNSVMVRQISGYTFRVKWYTNQIFFHGNYESRLRTKDLENHSTDWNIPKYSFNVSTVPDEDSGNYSSQVPPSNSNGYRKGTWSGGKYGSGTFTASTNPWNLGLGTEYDFNRSQNVTNVLNYMGDYLHYTSDDLAQKTHFNSGTNGAITSSGGNKSYPGDYPKIDNPTYAENSWGIPNSWLQTQGYQINQSESYYVDPKNAKKHPWGGIVQEFIDDIAWIETYGTEQNNSTFPPSITSQPSDVNVDEGDAASFTVTVGGSEPLTYQWQKDGSDINGADSKTYNISSASIGDEGEYRVIVSNSAGSVTSSIATLTVNPVVVEPDITDQPVDETVDEGGTASFTVTAGGTGPLSYQWQKDGADINGADSKTYNISSASIGDEGEYRVIVSNSAGSVTSNSATLIVTPIIAPSITTQPSDVNVDEGDAASFSVSAAGTGPLSYQWQKDGADISGATDDSYTISNVSLGDEGEYQVIVSNSAGNATSNKVTLAINKIAPSITSQPSDETVLEGEAATFSVSATGSAPISYQWQKDGSDISGATSKSYSLSSTSLGDAGDYRVIVSNSAGSVTSNSANLTVTAIVAPSITSQPSDVNVDEGDAASFKVTAGGTGPLSYQWQKDGSDISGATDDSYSISSAAFSDEGEYQVIISNSAGNVTSNAASLTINSVPPSITSQPADEVILEGEDVSFSVSVSGTAPLNYQWQKDGTDISGATSNSYDISNAGPSDAGDYSVVVTNSEGSATSNTASLIVNPIIAPSITTQPLDVAVDEGDDATFIVSAGGTAPMSYQWQKDGSDISGATANSYSISNATFSDEGEYQVVVSNSAGVATSTVADLVVNSVAPTITSHPQDIAVLEGGNITFGVSATGSAILTYQWMKDGVDIVGATSEDYSISSVSQNDIGSYQVVVSNGVGSVTSNTADLTINQVVEVPLIIDQPTNLSVAEGDGASFTVSVSGTAPFSYQWQKDGVDISGADSKTYSITNSSATDMGDYQVMISNSAGSVTSNTATLVVNQAEQAPVISDHPDDVTVSEGAAASFSASVSGTAPFTYQWQKDGSDISGATADSYTISNISLGDEGEYQVVVSNNTGSVTSNAATLIVNQTNTAPTISNIPNFTIEQGQVLGPIEFTVTDLETPDDQLQLTAESSEPTIVAENGIRLGGSGSIRELTIIPTEGQFGNVLITLRVSDGELIETEKFSLDIQELVASSPISVSFSYEPITCWGASDGEAEVIAKGGVLPHEYKWSTGAVSSKLQNLSAGTYNVTVTDAAGNSVNSSVTIDEPTQIIIDAVIAEESCLGNDGSITLSVTGGSGGYTFQWSDGSTTKDLKNLTAGIYSVIVTDFNGCSIGKSFSVNQKPGPSKPTIQNDGNLLTASKGDHYQWYLDGQQIDGANHQTLEISLSAIYSVVITDSFGCSAASDKVSYEYIEPLDVVNQNLIQDVKYYPNPASSQLNLEVEMSSSANVRWTIYSLEGRPVLRNNEGMQDNNQFKTEINVDNLKAGIYLIHLKIGGERVIRPFIKL